MSRLRVEKSVRKKNYENVGVKTDKKLAILCRDSNKCVLFIAFDCVLQFIFIICMFGAICARYLIERRRVHIEGRKVNKEKTANILLKIHFVEYKIGDNRQCDQWKSAVQCGTCTSLTNNNNK